MTATQKDEINVKHPDYDALAAERGVYEDVIKGTRALRGKATTYLPKFPAERSRSYKFRSETSTHFNLTKKTRDKMVGLTFKDEISIGNDVSPSIVPLFENIDNGGTHFDVFARQALQEQLAGFAVIVVDMPSLTDEIAESRRQFGAEADQRLGLRPYWALYNANSVINGGYRFNRVSNKRELEFIVFREVTRERNGTFIFDDVIRYRHLYLKDGVLDAAQGNSQVITRVYWEVKRETKDEKGNTVLIPEGAGFLKGFDQIPVAIVGELFDRPRLMDIVDKNIQLFQVYSDFMMDVHKILRPVAVAKNLSAEPGGQLVIGTDVLIETNTDGDFKFVEPAGTSLALAREVIRDMRDDIALMGLSLMADKTAKVELTATEALLNNVGELSELHVLARSLQDALELALGHTAVFLGLPRDKGGSIKLGTAWNKETQAVDTSGGTIPEGEPQAKEMVN